MIPEAITGDQFSSSPSTHLRRSLGRQHRGSVKGQRRWGADDVVYLLLIFSFFKKIYRKDVGVFNPKRLNPADQEDAVNAQKDDDDLRRNVDVMEILRKMRFPRVNGANDEKSPKTTLEHDYIKIELTNPAIKGTLNVLKACLKTNIARVVFPSLISTLTAKDTLGVYVLSKLLTEEVEFEFAEKNNIDLISVITTTVGGSFLTPSVPISIQVLLSPVASGSNAIVKTILFLIAECTMHGAPTVQLSPVPSIKMFLPKMPKSKCDRPVTLSKTKKKGRAHKEIVGKLPQETDLLHSFQFDSDSKPGKGLQLAQLMIEMDVLLLFSAVLVERLGMGRCSTLRFVDPRKLGGTDCI
ncbi:dihydroflavonol-4-reductase [Phtheirospermum japonicum]|uniref:Dihydroflavonol-4-reductase n=1 Tax=Phtheirospermum japonicum TaxID=374723 RepID=A0A830C1B6_9LAMI|nr:dihydroflavonol-4-reductase [Phtheirospermum japonicum]